METPEAPDVAPVAEPADAEPTTEGGAAESQPAEGGELDISTLPQQAQEYIHELRDENRDKRKAHEPYKNAFSAYNEAEQEYLLNMVTTLAVDQESGAQAMLELSQKMLGIEQAAEETVADPQIQQAATEQGMTREELVSTVQQTMEQEKLYAAIEAETIAVGFDPKTVEAGELWDMAVALDEMELAKVAPLYRQFKGIPEPEAKEPLKAADVNPEPEPDPSAFPVTAAANGGSDGTNAEDRQVPHAIGSQELRDQVLRRIAASDSPGQ